MTQERLKRILNGAEDAIPFIKEINDRIKVLEDLKRRALPIAWDEALKHSEKSYKENGIYVEKRIGYAKYDYDSNAEYREKKKELKELEENLKQASKSGKSIIDNETGEIYEPLKVKSYSKDSLIIK